jgi:hypothetical protein
MRIIQISDTHLSPGKAHFADNWAPLASWIAGERPDLVIQEGTKYAAGLMRDLRVRFRAVPGNHDIGEAQHPRQLVNAERLSRWRAHFGPAGGSRISRATG